METGIFVAEYFKRFESCIDKVEAVSAVHGQLSLSDSINSGLNHLLQSSKIYFVGNGGSAGISQHLAVDFWKNGKMRAQSFNDASLLTCIGNDLGYENLFSAPLEMFLEPNDAVICISSSGKSENILRAAKMGKEKGAFVITLSGFDADNPLRSLGDINFYVPSHSYGMVEISHELILHCILDTKLYTVDRIDIFNRNQPL